MQNELRKLAEALRKEAGEHDKRKLVKCAELIRGSVGLTLLKRKLGRK